MVPNQSRAEHRAQQMLGCACMLLAVFVLYALMGAFSGENPASYEYNSYLLQAQAWLRGETALDRNYPYLELAVYEGKYYVSFPPVPSLPMVLYCLIWGDDVPGGLFQKFYIAFTCMVVMAEIQHTKRMHRQTCFTWAILICLGSALLPIGLLGGVWYEAQILALLFGVSAVSAIRRQRPTLACVLYALGVGCRPFTVLLGPVLLAMYLQQERRRKRFRLKKSLKRLLPGVIAGLCIAACYGWYNWIRFDNPFEFGHNYLPEFTRSAHGQLSLHYVGKNWRTLFFGPPFRIQGNSLKLEIFGFSMFLSCPIFICGVVWMIKDMLRRRMTPVKWLIIAAGSLNILLLLMHRTLGGHQFGARYALELLPMAFAWYLLSGDRREPARWEIILLGFGLLFNFIGGCIVHI